MKGHARTRLGSTTGRSAGSPRRDGTPGPAALPGHLIPVLFFVAILAGFLLAAPADAAGFVSGDCTCPSSGYFGEAETAGSTTLDCSWYPQGASTYAAPQLISVVTRYPNKASAVARIRETNDYNYEAIRAEKKNSPQFSCLEDTYGDTRSSSICGAGGSYQGLRSILYRDTYLIELGAEGYRTGQAVKNSFDSLESCMKNAADAHAARQSGTSSGPGPAGVSQPGLTGAGTTPASDNDELLDDLIKDMGDGINEGLPLPVNWTAVPEAIGNSVTPAVAGAAGALIGGIAGAAVLVGRIPWPAGSTGGSGSEPPGGQPVPEPGVPVQGPPGGEPSATESPAVLPAEPPIPPPAEPPAVPAAPAGENAVPPVRGPGTGKRVLTPDEEDLRDFIKKTIERTERESADWLASADALDVADTVGSIVEKSADVALDIGSFIAPGPGDLVKNIYGATKTILKGGSKAIAEGGGIGDVLWGLGKGTLEAATDIAFNKIGEQIVKRLGGKFPLFQDYKPPEGTNFGGLSLPQIYERLKGGGGLPDTGDALQSIRQAATERLSAPGAVWDSVLNAFQGHLQGKHIWDPLKQKMGF